MFTEKQLRAAAEELWGKRMRSDSERESAILRTTAQTLDALANAVRDNPAPLAKETGDE